MLALRDAGAQLGMCWPSEMLGHSWGCAGPQRCWDTAGDVLALRDAGAQLGMCWPSEMLEHSWGCAGPQRCWGTAGDVLALRDAGAQLGMCWPSEMLGHRSVIMEPSPVVGRGTVCSLGRVNKVKRVQ